MTENDSCKRARMESERNAANRLAAIRAEIALVSGVVNALATAMVAWDTVRAEAVDTRRDLELAERRLIRLLAQERELMAKPESEK